MSISFGSTAHEGAESHHYYRQASAPTASDPLQIGDLWSDTSANLLKRCTSVSPVTFVSIEGGSSAHDLFSSTHGDVDELDTPVDNDVLTFDNAAGSWKAEAADGHAHANDHAAVTMSGAPDYITLSGQDIVRGQVDQVSDVTGVLPIANGGTNLSANPKVEAVISAASLKGATTNGAGDADKLPESAETATNKVNYDFMAFDTATEQNAFFQYSIPQGWNEGTITFRATEQNAFFQYSIPQGWNEGTITFRVKWTNAAGLTTETVVFGLKAVALSNDDALDTAFGTEVTVTDTWIAQNDVHISPESAALTIGGTPAAGDIVLFNIARKTASDNLTGDARLLEIILTFTRDSYTDS